LDAYTHARRAENELDFDDLEAGAVALLSDSNVRTAWQTAVRAVLVDEFQDTNERQRQIVYALTNFYPTPLTTREAPNPQSLTPNSPSSLFVVGDAKQSIYRFRGADVTVFRRVQGDVTRAGGQIIALDLTFRAHRDLVETTNRLLAPILGETEQPGRPYVVPFAPLTAYRSTARSGIAPPFVEFLLGIGESASAGRQSAADGLAARLIELRERQDIEWRDVALLFRASRAFAVYEDALERAGIPFVTVAGRGFYNRPEVRGLLNALLAVADPADDLALVGFLRAPFVGLTDAALYALRYPPPSILSGDSQVTSLRSAPCPQERRPENNVGSESVFPPNQQPCAIWPVLNHPALPYIVPPDDLPRAMRGRHLVAELHGLIGRAPVATLLKRLLDRTHYRAALGAAKGGARAQRNVDKLLADAHTSGLTSAREFVEYVRTLRDTGARESEAPTEAGSAVQLMTVHKAKGLEFPVVVVADAAHAGHRGTARVWLDEQLGVTLDLRDEENRRPAAHTLATLRNTEREEAEDRRLLYVAATRAREKLLISAHTSILKGGRLRTSGWLKLLGQVAGLDEIAVGGMPAEVQSLALAQDVGCRLYPQREERPTTLQGTRRAGRRPGRAQDLVPPLITPSRPLDADGKLSAREAQPPRRVWRVVPQAKRFDTPPWVVGTLVHAALRHWRFADDGLHAFLRPFALDTGVVDEDAIRASIRETARLLRRFRAHSLWTELDGAQRWHEVPFSLTEDGRQENGIIDLLYRVDEDWRIAEFKTDRLGANADLRTHIQEAGYDDQVRRYLHAIHRQLGIKARAFYVFLNVGNQLHVVPAP
jgi:ATP-dependent exoDNAse (exonuclease V) beta subunit